MAWRTVAAAALFVALGSPAPGAVADAPAGRAAAGPTPPRLRFVDGEVSFWRPGAEDWAPAKVNTPLAAGDALSTGTGANLELEIGPGAFVRAGEGTELALTSLEADMQQYKLTAGHIALDARRLPGERAIEVDTPNGAFTVDHPGYYRIDVDGERTTFSTRRDGRATVVPAAGEATDIGAGRQVVLEGTDEPRLATGAAPAPDPWDRWNLDRDEEEGASSGSARYASPDVAGGADLDRYGAWRDTPRYGPVWVPRAVGPSWAPYSTGRWLWDPYYGWSWIDDAPWGWAPYHYGRWVYLDAYWGWAPGPVVVAPVYAPALVAFLGPHVSVGVGVPFVSWVALGWGEPLIPWWGPVGFFGTCWWGGWGGPRVVNNVVIHRHTYVNVRNVTAFHNQTVRGGVVAVDRDHFGRGHVERGRLARADLGRLDPIRGRPGVKPTPASLVPERGRGIRPPAVNARPVVATRPPQDPSRRLRAAGLDVPARTVAPARLVPGPRKERDGQPRPWRTRVSPPPGSARQDRYAGLPPARRMQTPDRPVPPVRAFAPPARVATQRPRGPRSGAPAFPPPFRPGYDHGGGAVSSPQNVATPSTPRPHGYTTGPDMQPAGPRGHISAAGRDRW